VEEEAEEEEAEDARSSSEEGAAGYDSDGSANSSSQDPTSPAGRAAAAAAGGGGGANQLHPREVAELAAVLGCRPGEVGAALRDRTKTYLPSRFREMLGKRRVTTFRTPPPQPHTAVGGGDDQNAVATNNMSAVVQAVRVHLHQVACGEWSRWGCIAGDVVVEVPFAHDVEVVDTPGAPTTEASAAAASASASAAAAASSASASDGGWLNAHSRSHLVRSLGSQTLDVLLCVMDGGAGPSRELRAALRDSRALDAMVRREDGGSLSLMWTLVGAVQFESSFDP
jgi:hypothetical protein